MTKNSPASSTSSRRRFIAGTSLAALGSINLISCKKSAPARPGSGIILGEGAHQYEVTDNWAMLPDKYTWQTTHNVAVDGEGLLYVIHEGKIDQPDHPSIFVFDESGKFVRAFGKEFQGGGHGLEVRKEGKEEFLYVTGYQHLKNFKKLTLTGETVWEKRAPMESGNYPEGEDTKPEKVPSRKRNGAVIDSCRPTLPFWMTVDFFWPTDTDLIAFTAMIKLETGFQKLAAAEKRTASSICRMACGLMIVKKAKLL